MNLGNLTSWNGNNFAANGFTAMLPPGQMINLSNQAVYVDRAEDFPYLSGAVLPAHAKVILVKINDGQDIPTKRELLKSRGWFDITDFTPHQLIGTDENSKQWQLTGIVVSVVPYSPGADVAFLITLAVQDPIWRVVTITSDGPWNIAADTASRTITVLGNLPTRPVFTITPTQARTGQWGYRRYVPVYNRLSVSLTNRPIELTNGGWDTTVPIGAGKMLASGDDLRIVVDGVQVNRWLSHINQADTKVWSNISYSKAQVGSLKTNLPNNGSAVAVEFKVTTSNKAVLTALKSAANPVFMIGSEVFTYSPANIDLVNYKITGCSRAQKTTSFAVHTAGDNIIWIEHDIWIIYGNSAAIAPDVDDTQKPLLNLTSSTNTSWVFANFYDTSSARPAAWAGAVSKSTGKQSAVYTGDQQALANPSTELGLRFLDYMTGNVWKSETATLAWTFTDPCGITTVSMSGKKYAWSTTWIQGANNVVGLQYSNDGVKWFTAWTETIPGTPQSWTSFTHNTVALGATYPMIRLVILGSLAASANNEVDIQGDTVTLALDSAKTPVVSMLAEDAQYYANYKLTNTDTGEYILLAGVTKLNVALAVDCEAETIMLADGTNLIGILTLSSFRKDWLTLGPGSAHLQFDDVGTLGLSITTAFYDKTI